MLLRNASICIIILFTRTDYLKRIHINSILKRNPNCLPNIIISIVALAVQTNVTYPTEELVKAEGNMIFPAFQLHFDEKKK